MAMSITRLSSGMLFSVMCLLSGISIADNHSMMEKDAMMKEKNKSMEIEDSHPMMKSGEMESMKGEMNMQQMEMKEENSMQKKGM